MRYLRAFDLVGGVILNFSPMPLRSPYISTGTALTLFLNHHSNLPTLYSACFTIPSISHLFSRSFCISQFLSNQIKDPIAPRWNSIIKALSQSPNPRRAIHYYNLMVSSRPSSLPDGATFSLVLKASEKTKDVSKCKELHASIIRYGFESDVVVCTNLIRCYAAVGGLNDMRKVFDEMPQRDLITWNSMISCYSHLGLHHDALKLFDEMQTVGVGFDGFSLVGLLSACAHVGALNIGVKLHKLGTEKGLLDNVFVGNALIDMYAKCGRLDEAVYVFNGMKRKDLFSWNSVIGGCGVHGYGDSAISFFNKMMVAGLKPDSVTFLGLLCGCSHQGLVDEGIKYFDLMRSLFGVKPNVKHYGCMVDLFGRAGMLSRALNVIENSEFVDSPILWRTFLASCRIHKDINNGEKAMEKLNELGTLNAGDCILLSGIYTDLRDLRGVVKMRKMIKHGGLKTIPSWSSIDIDGEICNFAVNDRSHLNSEDIYNKL